MVVSGKQRATGNAAGDVVQHCVGDAVTIKCAGAAAKLVQHDEAVAGCMLHSRMSLLMDPYTKGQVQAAASTSCGLLAAGARDVTNKSW